ncbi:MAG: hypothetical protein Q8Q32_01045 [bacterium]|nr:hypothetical protein [bacterium]
MNTTTKNYLSAVIIALLILLLSLPFLAYAEVEVVEYNSGYDSGTSVDSETSASKKGVEASWKVEEGERSSDDTTTSSPSSEALPIREGGQTVDAGTIPEKQEQGNNQGSSSDDGQIKSFIWTQTSGPFKFSTASVKDIRDGSLDGISIEALTNGSEDAGSDATATLRVNAVIVRGWDPETKEAVRARLAENDEKNDANTFGLFTAVQALDNQAIKDIVITDEDSDGDGLGDLASVSVSYTAQVRLFGFIKREVDATATAVGDGEVQVRIGKSTPILMRLFSWKGDQSEFTDIASDIQARIGRLEISDLPLER